ncbi:MAG: hypothetical protein J1F64_04505 [Oscillospiraceae bacterium]|nr:hypothetical protein [Oscillospiraceae bacterium]
METEKNKKTIDLNKYDSGKPASIPVDKKKELDNYISQCNKLDEFLTAMKHIELNYDDDVMDYGINKLNKRAKVIFAEQISIYENNESAVESVNLPSSISSMVVWVIITVIVSHFFPTAGKVMVGLLILYIFYTILGRAQYRKHKKDIDLVTKLLNNGFEL